LLAQILQPLRSVDEHHNLASTGHAAPDRLLTQAGTKPIAGFEARYICRGFPVANWMALFVGAVLGEHAAQIDLAGLGFAISLFASPSLQLLRHHGHARPISTHIHNGRIAPARLGWPFLPGLSAAAHALNDSLNLPRRHADAASLLQMPFGLQVGRLISAFQANELGQSWCVADLQSQCGVGRIMAPVLARVIIVIPSYRKAAEDPLRLDGFPAFAHFPGFGLVGSINAVGRLLKQPANQVISRFENGRAHQHLQLSDSSSFWGLGFKLGNQALDFFVLGQEDFRWNFFFFEPAICWRVSSMTKSAYCSVSFRSWL